MPYARELTKRQQQILDFIRAELRRIGYPPSVREIGEAVGLSSSSTVHSHLAALESKGFIKRDPSKPRALEVYDFRDRDSVVEFGRVHEVPVLGQVAAGQPILAAENVEQTFPLPTEFADEQSFILRVRGDSMIDVGILDGDYVVVRQQSAADNGDIVVAMVDEGSGEPEATVKSFYREPDRIRLQPQNATLEPMYFRDVTVLGKVVALFRRV